MYGKLANSLLTVRSGQKRKKGTLVLLPLLTASILIFLSVQSSLHTEQIISVTGTSLPMTVDPFKVSPDPRCVSNSEVSILSAPQKSGNLSSMQSTCRGDAQEHARAQRVISYSLYIFEEGGTERFFEGIKPILSQASILYPGWVIRIYTNVPRWIPTACELILKYDHLSWCDITDVPGLGDLSSLMGMTWRFLPLSDPTVDIFISRDLDSPLSVRERIAVAEWESSNYTFHALRDHMFHGTAMLGGLWGAKNRSLDPSVSKMIQREIIKLGRQKLTKGWDQDVLIYAIYQYNPLRADLMAHDSYSCERYPNGITLPFPTQRTSDLDYAGVYYRAKVSEAEHLKPCPIQCRPDYGKDWEYC